MFASHLSYRAGILPPARTESPRPLPVPLSNRRTTTVTNGGLKPQREEDKKVAGLPPHAVLMTVNLHSQC